MFFNNRKLRDLENQVSLLKLKLSLSEAKVSTTELIRRQLSSLNLSDFTKDDKMSESERREYVSAISAVWPRLERDIKRFLYDQLIFTSNNSESWDQVIFGRGTFNGMDLLLNHWRKVHEEHQMNSKPKEDFDQYNPLPEA